MSIQTDIEFAEVDVEPTLAVLVSGTCSSQPSAITDGITTAFGTLMAYLSRLNLASAAPPRTIYTCYDAQSVTFQVAMPIARPHNLPANETPAAIDTLRGCKALRFTHHGPYRNLMQTYGQITLFLKETGRLQSDADWAKFTPMWEEYLNDPQTTPESELLTYIYLPLS